MPRVVLFVLLATWFAIAAGAEVEYLPGLDTSAMDRSADPCEDFSQYACGSWLAHHPIPSDQSAWGTYSKMADDNRVLLRAILDEAAAKPGRNASEQKTGDYYASCMDEAGVEALGAKPLEPELEAIASMREVSDLARVVAPMHESTYAFSYPLFGFSSTQDYRNSQETIASVDQSGLGLPDRDYYLKDDERSTAIRARYREHVQKMLALLGDAPEAAGAGAERVVAMETELAKASLTRVERRDPAKVYHRVARSELSRLAPAFQWDAYLEARGTAAIEELNVAVPTFLEGLQQLLESTPVDDWKTYLRWHLVNARAAYLGAAFDEEDFEFNSRFLRGAKEQRPRWKRCVGRVDRHLGEALGQVYVAKYFSADTRKRALRMVRQIEQAMDRDIDTIEWMSPATKKEAHAKVKAVVNKIGHPEKWRDYSSLEIVGGDYLGNARRAMAFEQKRQLHKIGRPLERGEWYLSPPTVNAYYNEQMNDINFPAGVLQPPAFDPAMDDAPNYGDTGGTIGHELTHGFDDQGRKFDARGNLRDWWSGNDGKAYDERAACISDQYSGYVVVDDVRINGKLPGDKDYPLR